MAEPGDPKTPDSPEPARQPAPAPAPEPDLDALIGFSSAEALAGRPRVQPTAEPAISVEPPPIPPAAYFTPGQTTPAMGATASRPLPEEAARTSDIGAGGSDPNPMPVWERETPPSERTRFGRASGPDPETPGLMGLFAVYALILFAVPTLGVSALIGLMAVTGRATPEHPLTRGHFIFQQRTLWAAAVAALLGVILIVVNLGVFVLFLLAVWTLVRGAYGVLTLKAGKPIKDPRSWLI